MPCYDGGPSREQQMEMDKNYKIERAGLCAVLTVLEDHGYLGLVDKINEREAGISKLDLKKWWLKHKEEDRKRVRAEQEQINKERMREAALKKLTDEEKKILGVK